LEEMAGATSAKLCPARKEMGEEGEGETQTSHARRLADGHHCRDESMWGSCSALATTLERSPPLKETDWNWPSIDHLKDAGTAEVAIETRLVNDMKTIMSEKEFGEMVAHLAQALKVTAQRLPPDWRCERSFAVKQKVDEPPIAVNKGKPSRANG
jgi:hypothetical protein